MLVLSRKLYETIVLPSVGAAIQVLGVRGKVVRLGIAAPPTLPVLCAELAGKDTASAEPQCPCPPAANLASQPVPRSLEDRLQEAALGLGLCRLELDAGQLEEACARLAAVQVEMQSLRQILNQTDENPRPQNPGAERKRQRALVVEDNGNERELLAEFLRLAGLEVDTASDGSDALDYLRQHARPDVVLLDMGLPRIDGPTVVREIRSDRSFAGMKIFGVTGHLPGEFNLQPGPGGIDRWFLKPLDPAALVRDLRQLDQFSTSAS